MDRAGRFDLRDGLAIANTFDRMSERNRENAFRSKTDNYLNRIAKGEKIDPTEEGFDYRAHLTASAAHVQSMMNDQKLQAARLEADDLKRQQNQADIDARIVQANDYASRGMQDKAIDTLIPVYQYLPDGYKFKQFKTDDNGNVDRSKMVLVGPDGKTESVQPTPSIDQALNMAVRFSKSYRDIYHQSKEKAMAANIKAMANSEIWRTADGKEAVYVPFVDVDEKGNYQLKETWKDPKTGKTLKGFDEETGQVVESKLDFKSPAYWNDQASNEKTEVDRKRIEASTRKTEQDIKHGKERQPLEVKKLKAETELAEKRAADIGQKDADQADEKQRKKNREELELALKPFAGSKAAYDMEGNLTDEGKTALDAAMKLKNKYDRREPLSDDEKKKIKYAIRAVDKFKQISDSISDGGATGQAGAWRQFSGEQSPSGDINVNDLVNIGKQKTGR